MPNAQENNSTKTKTNTSTKTNPYASYFPGIILAIVTAIAIIIGGYFFSQTGITNAMFLTINFTPLTNALLTINFIIFLIAASFALAIIMLLGRNYSLKNALIFSVTGYLIGGLVSIVLFNLLDFALPIIAGAIAIPLGIKYLSKREDEVKYLKTIRAGTSAAGRILTIMCLVFTIFLLITAVQQKEQLQNSFVDQMLAMTVGSNVSLSDTFNGQLANAISTQQQQTVDLIKSQPELTNLQAKNDPNGVALAAKLDALKTQFGSDTVKQQISTALKSQNLDIGKELLGKFPMIGFLSQYAWLLYPFSAFILLLFIGGLLVKNLAGVIYGLLTRAF